MATHFEEFLRRDIERIRDKVSEMAVLIEGALNNCLRALTENNRVLAFAVILGDQRIDQLEKEVDRLCLEFMLRQQPVALPLRLAYATIRINLELERMGDYAEAIARQVLKLTSMGLAIPVERYVEMADISIPMLRNSVRAFVEQDAALARETMANEDLVDVLKRKLNSDLMNLSRDGRIPFEALNAMMMIARHFERVSDQAKNICFEVLYMCTGEYNRHKGTEASRLIFVDRQNASVSPMAEAIGNSLGHPQLIFASAGLQPTAIDPRTVSFLKRKGLDLSRQTSKAVNQIPNFDYYKIIVALSPEAQTAFPKAPSTVVCLEWPVPDPSAVAGSAAEVEAAYEATYQFLREHIEDLVQAVLGDKNV